METRERGCTHIDHPRSVASTQVEQHRGLVEVRQHGHVFNQVILRRVHLLDVPVLHGQSLKRWTQADMRKMWLIGFSIHHCR